MGRVLLVGRLAVRNVRRHPAEAALLLLAITAATTQLTLGLVLQGVTNDPYETTREATAGPDVVASAEPFPVGENRVAPVDPAELEALADAPGVIDHSGPYPAAVAKLEVDGVTAEAWAQGRDSVEVSVDQPRLTEGSWVEDGGAVVEAAFADALDVGPGDRVQLNGRSFQVVGVAITAAAPYTDVCFGIGCGFEMGRPPDPMMAWPENAPSQVQTEVLDFPLPQDDAGLVWLTQEDARSLAPAEAALSYAMNLKLADPTEAPVFVEANSPTGWSSVFLASWQDIREVYGRLMGETRLALITFSSLLTLLAMASVTVLVGGRMADQTRRVGLLKAVGGTPGLVAVVLLAEYVLLALFAAVAGIAVGWLAAPLLADPGAGLLGNAGAPTLTLGTVGRVTALAVGVAAVASFVPAVRAARTSTVHALADQPHPPRRMRWLIALSARLPVSLLLALRVLGRRPRRVLLSIASIVVTVSGIVVVLAARATIASDWDGATGMQDPEADHISQVLLVVTVMLVALAAVNAIVITWSTALDARRSSALARALGATPQQVSTGLSAAQILPAFVGAFLGIPGGLALWGVLSNDEAQTPTFWQVLLVVAGTVLVVAGLTAVPARLGARRPIAPILQSEHA